MNQLCNLPLQSQMKHTRMSIAPKSALNGIVLAVSLAFALLPPTANATLGETEASIALDGQQLQSSIKMSERAHYRVHELKTTLGTVVHEFAGADGTVFAIAWSGPSMPDLRQTLGRYFEVYTAGAKVNRAGHAHLQFEQDGLVVEVSGHMRAFTGRAYLPQSVPAGMALGELR